MSLTDPYVDEAGAAALGVPLLALDELLRTSDVVTSTPPRPRDPPPDRPPASWP